MTQGLPGSGKTTWACQWVALDPAHRFNVNRDDMRDMAHGGFADQEVMITTARDALIETLLKRGVSVVVSDTNLKRRYVRDLLKIATRCHAEFRIQDFTSVPLETCILRDERRGLGGGRKVGAEVIQGMHARFIVPLNGRPMSIPVEPADEIAAQLVEHEDHLPYAVIVDLDGTLAEKGTRSPFDETRVHEDTPRTAVIAAVQAAWMAGDTVLAMSGRTAGCYDATWWWLEENLGEGVAEHLFMRAVGDGRPDNVVKLELFNENVRGKYNIRYVLDDRQKVVDMWRETLGLDCFQVAPGDF